MSVRERDYEIFHDWVRDYANGLGGTELANDKVIPEDDPGARPSLEYVTVELRQHGTPLAHDERVDSLDGLGGAQYVIQGERSGIAVLHFYGNATQSWSGNLALSLKDREVQRVLHEAGLVVMPPRGPLRPQPRILGANRERHYVHEFPYAYREVSDTIPATALTLQSVELSGELYPLTSGSDTVTLDTDVSL